MVRKIFYWIATVLIALAYAAAGYADIAQPADLMKNVEKLGYPSFFYTILGAWKLAAALILLSPGLPRAKEWAYAGILINLTAAAATHAHVGDPVSDTVTPLVILAVAITSWALRPAGRRLPGPWL